MGIAYTDYYDLFTIGAGYLDVWAALSATDVVPSGSNAGFPARSTQRANAFGILRVESYIHDRLSNVADCGSKRLATPVGFIGESATHYSG